MRDMTVAALRELGFAVLPAASAAGALQILEDRPEIGLLFTDIVMPDMNGRRLAEEALKMRPSLKVLFTTGYTPDATGNNSLNGLFDRGIEFLAKPFTLDQLGQKVRDVLSRGTARPAGSHSKV
jgi:CheY-like chemotaxis protein